MRTKRISLCILLNLVSAPWPLNLSAQNVSKVLVKQVTPEAASATLAYWTPERLQSAVPMDLLRIDANASPVSLVLPSTVEPQFFLPGQPPGISQRTKPVMKPFHQPAVSGFEPLAFAYPYPFTRYSVLSLLYDESISPVLPYRTMGKLFFTLGGQDFVCSAQTSRPHLVLTARHCIYDVDTQMFATNVTFYPGWHSGPNATLGGVWKGRSLITWGDPATKWDIGYIQTFDDDGVGCGGSAGGNPIETYTGFLGASWGGDYSQRQWDEFGYPQGPPFNGQIMIQSESSTGALDQFGQTDTVEVGNDETGGSSGGVWILGLDPGSASIPPANPGGNSANGLNSFKFTMPDRSLAMNSPKFLDDNFNQLRLNAEGLPCP